MPIPNRQVLHCGNRDLLLDRPKVMGILNVTPDSFSDGGQFDSRDKALAQVEKMINAGADILDIGGESTRPGADEVPEQVELDRVIPVVEAISQRFDIVVSLDTSKPVVMREGAKAGAGLINDIRALREPGALLAVKELGLPVCLMHMQREPRTMQQSPEYDDVVSEVLTFLLDRRRLCVDAGIPESQIILDPGFGFGKNLDDNLVLLKKLERVSKMAPVLVGLSRKRMFAQILQNNSISRVTASVAAALMCVQRGASIVRVHDVEPTVQALAVYQAVIDS